MSEFSIKDGAGQGYRAQVDSDFRLRAQAAAISEDAYASIKHGRAYTVPAADMALALAGTEYLVLWFRNTDPNRLFLISRCCMAWNGGDTNHNRIANIKYYFGTAVPSANNTAITPTNLNQGSTQIALATVNRWDGVGNGMTVTALGTLVKNPYLGQGTSMIDMGGITALSYNQTLGITATPEEAGLLSAGIMGWFASEEEV